MNRKIMVWLMTIILLVNASPSLAGSQGKQTVPTLDKIKTLLTGAKTKKLRVTVMIRDGARVEGDLEFNGDGSLSGEVGEITAQGFTLWHESRQATIDYADLTAIKRESRALKYLADIGGYALLAAASVVAMPLIMVMGLLGMPMDC